MFGSSSRSFSHDSRIESPTLSWAKRKHQIIVKWFIHRIVQQVTLASCLSIKHNTWTVFSFAWSAGLTFVTWVGVLMLFLCDWSCVCALVRLCVCSPACWYHLGGFSAPGEQFSAPPCSGQQSKCWLLLTRFWDWVAVWSNSTQEHVS